MKKLIALILALILCLSLCACGGKETKLTLENYTQYITLETACSLSDDIRVADTELPGTGGVVTFYMGDTITPMVKIIGASSNFNYNNVKVKVRFSGTYYGYVFRNPDGWHIDVDPVGEKTFEYVLEATANIGGNSEKVKGSYILPEGMLSDRDLLSFTVEVIEVSGTISEAK